MPKIIYLLIFGLIILVSCKDIKKEGTESETNTEWKFVRIIKLDNIAPTGLLTDGKYLWISDAKNNRVVKTDLNGKFIKEYTGFKRPMHLSIYKSKVYVPEYLTDIIKIIKSNEISEFPLKEKPDAPAGVFVNDSLIAIADFYNHRIILQGKDHITLIGKEGHKNGELYYPTDVVIANNKIYVADAYNNRVQIFDFKGESLSIIGDKDKINVATGIEVAGNNIFVTDFEGSRILIYNLDGLLLKALKNHFNKPTDIAYSNNAIFISNYGDNTVSVIQLIR